MPRQGATPINTVGAEKKNLLLNTNNFLNQRAEAPITGTGGVQFLQDRWGCWFPSGGSYTTPEIRTSTLPVGFPGNPDITLAQRMVASNVNTGSFNRRQRILAEYLQEEEIDVVSFGFWAYVDNYQEVLIQFIQPSGSDNNWQGAGSGDIVLPDDLTISVDDPNGAWQFYKFENVPLQNRFGLELRVTMFNEVSTSVTTDTYVTEMMANKGPYLEPWSLRMGNQKEETEECKRWFRKSGLVGRGSAGNEWFPGTSTHASTDGRIVSLMGGSPDRARINEKFEKEMVQNPVVTFYPARTAVANTPNRLTVYNGNTLTTYLDDSISMRSNGLFGYFRDIVPASSQAYTFQYTADAEF